LLISFAILYKKTQRNCDLIDWDVADEIIAEAIENQP